MTPERAAEVLRMTTEADYREQCEAGEMGAEAIELLHWWFTEANEPQREAVRKRREKSKKPWASGQWIAAARAEWEKERENG